MKEEIQKEEKKIFLAIHDATPRFLNELETIFSSLDELGVEKYEILVTPNWYGQFPIEEENNLNKNFEELVESHLDHSELVLHGYTHASEKGLLWALSDTFGLGGELEFGYINREKVKKKLERGLNSIKEVFGAEPSGFVPPMWVCDGEALRNKFEYYTDKRGVDYFHFRVKSPVINYDAGRSDLLNRFAQHNSTKKVNGLREGVVRFALHPKDVNNGNFKQEIKDLKHLLDKGWEPALYEDYLQGD